MAKNNAKPCILYISRSGSVLDEKVSGIKKKIKGKINTDTDFKVYDSPEEIDESELLNFLGMPSFFSEGKVLVLKNVESYPASLMKMLSRQIKKLGSGVFLVMTSSKEKLNREFLEAVKSSGTIKSIRVPTAESARRWLKEKAELDGLNFSSGAMETFLENVDYQLDSIKHEYEKLYTYASSSKDSVIGTREVNRLVTRVYNLRVFDLVDYIGQRDKNGALAALRSVLEEKWALMGAVTLLHRCFKAMTYFKYNLDQQAEGYIRNNTRTPAYLVNKVMRKYRKFSGNYRLGEMIKIMGILNDYDMRFRDAHQPKNLMIGLISEITGD
ncbi:MAG: DNA polymerase III subunit delta [Actinomycetota bacterium]